MYPTTVVCLRNANSTRSRMAAWCHALSLAVQRLPAMNTVSLLSKSHHFWLAVFIDGNHCTKDRAWHQPAIRLLVEFAFLRQTIVVRYIQIFEKYFSAESPQLQDRQNGATEGSQMVLSLNFCCIFFLFWCVKKFSFKRRFIL